MVISFEEFLRKLEKKNVILPGEVRSHLDEMLKVGVGAQAKRNIYDERLVEDSEWELLVDAIMKAPRTYSGVTDAIRQVMRKQKLQGPAAVVGAGTVVGRAVSESSLAQTLHGQAALGTVQSAIHHVALYKKARVATLQRRWRNILIGRHVMWSTFDPNGADPFEFAPMPRRTEDIGPVLGLAEETRFQPLLLLRYELPVDATARIPRICEAYAGDVWVYYFRPADSDDVHRGYGRTYVWDSHAKTHAGRPEIVHTEVTGATLVADIEETLI